MRPDAGTLGEPRSASGPDHQALQNRAEPLVRDRTHRRARKRRGKIKIALIAGLVLVVAFALTGGIYVLVLLSSFSKVTTIPDAFPEEVDRPAVIEGAQTILLLGSDSRATGAATSARADTIMVVHVPADRRTVQVMSIMRDNWVSIPGHGEAKINAAMAYGGIPLMVQTVENILDARIDHVAVTDFESFKGLTTAVGGVTIENPRAFTAVTGAYFPNGEITLEGADALAFVRERKAFERGDYDRAANQQLLVKGLVSKLLSAETRTNPARISEIVDTLSPYLSVDAGFDAPYVVALGTSLVSLKRSDIRFFTSPTLGTGREQGQSIVKPDWDGLARVSAAITDGTLDQYEPTGK